MMLSRWRRVATGVAAGIIVLCAALIGASFRDGTGGVSVASDLRPANVIPIAEDPVDDADADVSDTDTASADTDATADSTDAGGIDTDSPDADSADGVDASEDDPSTDSVTVIEAEDLPASDSADTATDDTGTDDTATGDTDAGDTGAADAATDDADAAGDTSTDGAAGDVTTDDTAGSETDTGATTDSGASSETAADVPATADETLGIGGGVDDAECALDRLVIYAGARRGGVAGSIRNALAAAGFGVGCPAPVTVLASNCPLQFAGVLGAGSGYDPMGSFVASSSSVNRETMTAVMAAVGYSGAEINILDFSFINPDKPGEQWMAIFIPPTFAGWENLAGRAGLSPTTSSLCAPSGQLAG